MTQDSSESDPVASRVRNTEPFVRDVDNEAAREFRELLDDQTFTFAPGIYHALDGRLAEMAGQAGLVIGGPAFRDPLSKPIPGAQYAGSMAELSAYARGLYTHPATGADSGPAKGELL